MESHAYDRQLCYSKHMVSWNHDYNTSMWLHRSCMISDRAKMSLGQSARCPVTQCRHDYKDSLRTV